MSEQSERIVKKLWSYCQVLRDDGLSYQDYLEQLTFLLFPKDGGRAQSANQRRTADPAWLSLGRSGQPQDGRRAAELHYRDTLKELAAQGGMLGLIFRKSQNKIQDPPSCVAWSSTRSATSRG